LGLHFTCGDMFAMDADYRVNTVNCMGVMGAGVALAFRERYPEMFAAYQVECRLGLVAPGRLGKWSGPDCTIINLPTKRQPRNKSRYEDVEAGLAALRHFLEDKGGVRVTLPALGCGHGRLDWTVVRGMIEAHLGELDATIYVFTPEDSREMGRVVVREER